MSRSNAYYTNTEFRLIGSLWLLTRNKFLSSKNNPKISNEAQTIVITLNFYFVQSDNVGSRIRRLLAKAVIVPDMRTKYQSMSLMSKDFK